MTNEELILKKLAQIDTCVSQIRRLIDPAMIETDLVIERFVEHTLQIAIQAAMDVASHIVSDDRLGEPSSNRELFSLLAKADWVSDEMVADLGNMASFRNLLVHGYAEIDPSIVRSIVETKLEDLERFADAVRTRL